MVLVTVFLIRLSGKEPGALREKITEQMFNEYIQK
jgi:hypothetical protein